jgi:hypothetical protein
VSGAGVLASSDSTKVAAIVVAAVGAVVLLGLMAVLWSLARTMKALRSTADDLHREGLSVLGDMKGTVGQANSELERVDGLLGTAESISTTVDSASRLAYLAFSNPVIKVLAFGSGTARAARHFRKRGA